MPIQTAIYLDEKNYEKLRQESFLKKVTQSSIIRAALEKYFENDPKK